MRPCSPGGTTKAATRSPSAATPTCRTSSDTASARPRRWPRYTAFDPATTPTTSGDASIEQQPEPYRDCTDPPRPVRADGRVGRQSATPPPRLDRRAATPTVRNGASTREAIGWRYLRRPVAVHDAVPISVLLSRVRHQVALSGRCGGAAARRC